MDFTREPIIETVITPREGFKLVVRGSKGAGHEEYFVDAVEVVSFGNGIFFRSQEKPKSFLVPVIDYEVLEVRETRMVLKHASEDRSIKIAGGREKPPARKAKKEPAEESAEPKKKERRRSPRRRRKTTEEDTAKVDLPIPVDGEPAEQPKPRSMVPPPPTLISETIARYKEDDSFKDVFIAEEKEPLPISNDADTPVLPQEPHAAPVPSPEPQPAPAEEENSEV